MDIKSLLDQPHKLPNVPAVTQKLIASFSDEDVSFKQIAEQITADPALSAKLLRLANSAYFHLSRTIGTVDEALQMLGFVMVRNLVMGNGMSHAFRNTKGMDLQQFWLYNLYTASSSRWLASKAPPKPPSASFRANPGTGSTAGRCKAAANLRVKSRFRSGLGAVQLAVPVMESETTAWMSAARRSSRCPAAAMSMPCRSLIVMRCWTRSSAQSTAEKPHDHPRVRNLHNL